MSNQRRRASNHTPSLNNEMNYENTIQQLASTFSDTESFLAMFFHGINQTTSVKKLKARMVDYFSQLGEALVLQDESKLPKAKEYTTVTCAALLKKGNVHCKRIAKEGRLYCAFHEKRLSEAVEVKESPMEQVDSVPTQCSAMVGKKQDKQCKKTAKKGGLYCYVHEKKYGDHHEPVNQESDLDTIPALEVPEKKQKQNCTGKRKDGAPCKKFAVVDSMYCAVHKKKMDELNGKEIVEEADEEYFERFKLTDKIAPSLKFYENDPEQEFEYHRNYISLKMLNLPSFDPFDDAYIIPVTEDHQVVVGWGKRKNELVLQFVQRDSAVFTTETIRAAMRAIREQFKLPTQEHCIEIKGAYAVELAEESNAEPQESPVLMSETEMDAELTQCLNYE